MKISIKELAARVLDLKAGDKIYIRLEDRRQYGITYVEAFTSMIYVCSDLGSTSSSIFINDTNGIEGWLKECTEGQDVYTMYNQEDIMKAGWVCTNVSQERWCKKIDEFLFEFFDKDNAYPEDPIVIDLRDYTIWHIESLLNDNGYSLIPNSDKEHIYTTYREQYLYKIAEYIFTQDERN